MIKQIYMELSSNDCRVKIVGGGKIETVKLVSYIYNNCKTVTI